VQVEVGHVTHQLVLFADQVGEIGRWLDVFVGVGSQVKYSVSM